MSSIVPSLAEVFAALADPRHARGLRHPLVSILLLSCVARLAGARGQAGRQAVRIGRVTMASRGALVSASPTPRGRVRQHCWLILPWRCWKRTSRNGRSKCVWHSTAQRCRNRDWLGSQWMARRCAQADAVERRRAIGSACVAIGLGWSSGRWQSVTRPMRSRHVTICSPY